MKTLQANGEVLLRRVGTDDEWLAGDPKKSDEDELAVAFTEIPNWLEVGTQIEAIHLGDTRTSTFETKVFKIRRTQTIVALHAPTTVTEVDRRADKRILTKQPLEWSPMEEGSDPAQARSGVTQDISIGGLRFRSDEAPYVGQKVVIALFLPRGSASAFARCLETKKDRGHELAHTTRLEFVWAHPRSQQRLKDWVDESFERAEKMISEAFAANKAQRADLHRTIVAQAIEGYTKQ